MARFWRGEFSLALSFWVIGPLVVALAFVLPEGVGWLVRGRAFNPLVIFAAIVAIWTIVLVLQVYLTVGIWRSAGQQRFDAAGRRGLWGLAVQVLLVLGALNSARLFIMTGVPELSEGVGMALFDDPSLPPYSVRLMRDGSEAEIAGGFKYGLAREAETLFATAPQLRVVHLNSAGGRLGEAVKITRLIVRRQLDTYTSATCASACAVAYAAGHERYLRRGARLGFHRGIFAGNENAEAMKRLLLSAGIAPAFVDRAVAQPAESIWYPTDGELAEGRVVTAFVDSYRFAASGFGADATLLAFEGELRRTPGLEALSESRPELFDDIAGLYLKRYVEGRSIGEIEDEVRQTEVAPVIATRLPQVDDGILVDYARLLADQYAALGARDPAACFTYITRGSDARMIAMMGPALQKREVELTERVLRSKSHRAAASAEAVQAINVEVYKKVAVAFDSQAAALLSEPAKVQPDQYALFCNVAVARLNAITSLPAHEAGDLMSSLFTQTKAGNR
ncbi:MAG: hypothetical protein JSS04_07460 [Proteobacteria bacterium]|nr:hypothetical protein [Pseudomonadota bacterium]